MNFKKSFFLGNNQGFTLVELMITLAMSGIIVAAIYSAYIIQQKTYYTQGQVVEMQQNIRAALEMMSSEIRMAGYNPSGNADCAGVALANGSQLQIRMDLDNDKFCNSANEDVLYGIAADADGFVDNIDANNDGKVDANVELTRKPPLAGAQAIAEGIQAIEFTYIFSDGSTPPQPYSTDDLAKIQTVQITMLAVANQRDPKYTDTKIYTTSSNINWPLQPPPPAVQTGFNDNFRRRLLTSSVNLRNYGLK
jgi:type IV pilus assembly protein PilW